MLRLAKIDDWQISKDENQKRLRDAAYVLPPRAPDSETEYDTDPEMNIPLSKLAKKYRQERETSEDEDDIPLMELRKRLQTRELRQKQNEDIEDKDMECNDEQRSDNSSSLPLVESSSSDSEIHVNEVHSRHDFPKMETSSTVETRQNKSQKGGEVKQLLRLISN